MELRIRPPAMPVAMPGGGPAAAPPAPPPERSSVVTLVTREIDLLDLSTSGVAGQVYTADFFLVHPGDYSIKRLLVSAEAARPDRFAVQLVEKRSGSANDLTEKLARDELPADPVEITDIKDGEGWPVFLRLTAFYPSLSRRIFATLEILSSSVP